MITAAIQNDKWVDVYDENNRKIISKRGELYGYTSTTVSIKNDNWIEVFDERGRKIQDHHI